MIINLLIVKCFIVKWTEGSMESTTLTKYNSWKRFQNRALASLYEASVAPAYITQRGIDLTARASHAPSRVATPWLGLESGACERLGRTERRHSHWNLYLFTPPGIASPLRTRMNFVPGKCT